MRHNMERRGSTARGIPTTLACSGCRRTYRHGPDARTTETTFTETPNVISSCPTSLFQGSSTTRPPSMPAPPPPTEHNYSDTATRNISDNSELCTRTTWVDAETAYRQVAKGKANGNKCSLWLRWRIQKQLFNLGCFTQKHCGKVLFLGLLLLSLCCVGLKTASIETNVEKLWVEEGGRLERELRHTRSVLGEGSGSTYELLVQTPKVGTNLLHTKSLLLHYKALRAATKISVELYDRTWDFTDLCVKPSFPSINEDPFIDRILENLQPCTIITPLDCFWEASKLLGPEIPVHLPGHPDKVFRWSNLDPRYLVRSIKDFQDKLHVPISVDSIKEMLDRAGITTAYQEKPCLNPKDPECPTTAPNYGSSQPPDIGRELTGGCSGFAARYMQWEEDLIVGGVSKNRAGQIVRAEALQSMVMLYGERELYEYYRRDYIGYEWSLEKARDILQAWQRKFTQEINKVAVTTTHSNNKTDNIYPFSTASMLDLLQDFSQVSTVRVGLGYAFMLVYACMSMLRWNDQIQSQSGVGMAGVLLVSLSVAAGLGFCSVLGIKFNAATTQIIPFLALGLGVDDMFLIGHTVSENAQKGDIPYMEQTGECLKRVGVSVLITSLSNACAFFMAAIIPIPALRAFCLQAALLVLFNLATILLVFPAVISLDMIRREEQKVDVLCCITGSSTRVHDYPGSMPPPPPAPRVTTRGRTPPPDYYESTHPPGYSNHGMHQTIATTETDGTRPVTVLAPPKYDQHNFHCVPGNAVCPVTSSLPPSTTSSQQCLTPEGQSGCQRHCGCSSPKDCCSWPLTRLARNVLAPLLQKTPMKICVVVVFLIGVILGVIGIVRVEDGLDITDVVPRDTLEYKFLKARAEYFGFYNFYAVTKEDFDYPKEQQLLHDFHKAFERVDKIIKKEDGSLPDFWLILMRDWLRDMQRAFDRDFQRGLITRDGWYKEASDNGVLGYKLLVQTGDRDRPMDKQRAIHGRLVDKDGIIFPPAFYNFLTAWTTVDALAYYASEANLHPPRRDWTYVREPFYGNFNNATEEVIHILKSQPLIFSQMSFYLHDLGDTAAITDTVREIREISDRFAAHDLPNYPSGIVFTFWEQYLALRFYLMLALICVLAGIFLVLTIVLLNPWTALIVVVILSMMVVELFGFMGLIGIKLSAIPAVILIVSVGIGVEFTVHVCLGFITSIGSRNKRMRMALEHMFAPVVHGAMTTFLGVVMLALSEFDFIVKYFFVVLTALIVIGLLNGLILLPVLLSVIGPRAEVTPKDRSDFLAPPTPEPSPIPLRHHHERGAVRSVSRRVYPRVPSEISLTTITEEPSSGQYSTASRESGEYPGCGDYPAPTHESQIAVHVQPEVVVETTVGGRSSISSSSSGTNSPSSNNSTPPTNSRQKQQQQGQITTVKATTRVKVHVHTPMPGTVHVTDSEYKSKKRKSSSSPPEAEVVEVEEVEVDSQTDSYDETDSDGVSCSSA